MRHLTISFFTLLLTIAFSINMNAERKDPDFAYPKTVSKEALADIKKAKSSPELIDALVRYTIAQSKITDESFPDIVAKIDEALAREKDVTARSMLTIFKARVFEARRESSDAYIVDGRVKSTEAEATDYTEWSHDQWATKIRGLIAESLAHPEEAARVPITDYKVLLEYDDLDVVFYPTVLDFLIKEAERMLPTEYYPTIIGDLYNKQLEIHRDDIPAYIYHKAERGVPDDTTTEQDNAYWLDLYRQYSDNPYSGIFLNKVSVGRYTHESMKERSDMLKAHMDRWPDYPFNYELKSKWNDLNRRSAGYSSSGVFHSDQPISGKATLRNVNETTMTLYRVAESAGERPKDSELTPVESIKVRCDSVVPFPSTTVPFEFAAPGYGRYVIKLEYIDIDGQLKRFDNETHSEVITVTDLMLATIDTDRGEDHTLVVTDGLIGKPAEGVDILVTRHEYIGGKSKDIEVQRHRTDASGTIKMKYDKSDRYYIHATRGNDRWTDEVSQLASLDNNNATPRTVSETEIFTDLGVYRPGETVKWVAVSYNRTDLKRELAARQTFEVRFSDPNGQEITSFEAISDDYGRINGELQVPTDRMNGTFRLTVYNPTTKQSDSRYIEVAEYKAPTFEVKFDDVPSAFSRTLKEVKLRGSVATYSGVPLINTPVNIEISRSEWSWFRWWGSDDAVVIDTVSVTTNADGRFEARLPMSTFEEDGYKFFGYNAEASVTSAAGETQTGTCHFTVGYHSQIKSVDRDDIEISQPIVLPFTYESNDGVAATCYYNIKSVDADNNVGEIVKSGTFIPALPDSDEKASRIDLSDLPSGRYRIQACINDQFKYADSEYDYVNLFRATDKECPTKSILWIPERAIKADEKGNASILFGSHLPTHLYYMVINGTTVIERGWKHFEAGNHHLNVKVPAGSIENTRVYLLTVKDYGRATPTVTIAPIARAPKLTAKVESFRDKLTSGDVETWKFRFTDINGKPVGAAAMLDVYDHAIDAIMPNNFNMTIARLFRSTGLHISGGNFSSASQSLYGSNTNGYDSNSVEAPRFHFYDEDLFQSRYFFGDTRLKALGGAARRNDMMYMVAEENSVMAAGRPSDDMVDYEAADESDDTGSAAAPDLDNVEVRVGKLKTALWQPMLVADGNGDLAITFTAPNYNTTWNVKMIAYTGNDNILSDNIERTLVTSKPLMAQANLPRFLRQGDKATISALVINNTDEQQTATALVELFDPMTGTVAKSERFELQLSPREQRNCPIELDVPTDIAALGYRIRTANSTFSDGEQDAIPVLTAVSPVIETQPFYLNPGQNSLVKPIGNIPAGAKVTLEYCDNPMWYCLTAIPSIYENCITSTGAAHTLYSLLLAKGIADYDPSVREAIEWWKANPQDSMLNSMLEKNQSLKITELAKSPWLRPAQRQTAQMQAIVKLYDPAYVAANREAAISTLQSLQASNGGWRWIKECDESYYATAEVLELLGEMKLLGFIGDDDDELTSMLSKGVEYLDKKVIELYTEQKDKKDYSIFCYYSYVRSFYPEIERSRTLREMTNRALKIYEKNWRKYNLPDKAFAAILLKREHRDQTTADIVRSIKEFSIETPDRGTYWDNLTVGWYRSYRPVAATSLMLRAIYANDSTDVIIDGVRQWLLLQKQTTDWGGSSLAADAIYSLLSTGTNWLQRAGNATVKIGDTAIDTTSGVERYTGHIMREIELPAPGSTLSINRNGNSPAWGSLYAQYSAPMTQIEAASTDEISIEKVLYDIDGNMLRGVQHFKVGDKVRVMLTIKNRRDLEYVNVHDERCATMEPIDQLSGYDWRDGLGFYRETKDSETNFFIGWMPKGTHLISYDVTITSPGTYNLGIATVQSQYAPHITAHSVGTSLTVE